MPPCKKYRETLTEAIEILLQNEWTPKDIVAILPTSMATVHRIQAEVRARPIRQVMADTPEIAEFKRRILEQEI